MIVDYIDKEGIKRRVSIPNADARPEEGIPVSLDVDKEIYAEAPLEFRRRLIEELWNVELIELNDYLQPDSLNRIRAALLAAIKHDTMDILTYAQKSRSDLR